MRLRKQKHRSAVHSLDCVPLFISPRLSRLTRPPAVSYPLWPLRCCFSRRLRRFFRDEDRLLRDLTRWRKPDDDDMDFLPRRTLCELGEKSLEKCCSAVRYPRALSPLSSRLLINFLLLLLCFFSVVVDVRRAGSLVLASKLLLPL